MFIWDFVAELVLGDIFDWLYGKLIEGLGQMFAMMNGMSAMLFDMPWVSFLTAYFSRLGWMLYAAGLAAAVFEAAMAYQSGRYDCIKDLGMNAVRGFVAAGLFSTLPIALFRFSVTLQSALTSAITGLPVDRIGISGMAMMAGSVLSAEVSFVSLFLSILLGYAVIKVFFSGLKRGGILIIQIAVGSLYMFSIPRGYHDTFYGWCKQVIGLCLTMFLQSIILVAGLMVLQTVSRKERLAALYATCSKIFRYLALKSLAIRKYGCKILKQPIKKFSVAVYAQSLRDTVCSPICCLVWD